MDAVTALSGSGPGLYGCLRSKALADAGVAAGLFPAGGQIWSSTMARIGAAMSLSVSDAQQPPVTRRWARRWTPPPRNCAPRSPRRAAMTAAGLRGLSNGADFRGRILADAVDAAKRRSSRPGVTSGQVRRILGSISPRPVAVSPPSAVLYPACWRRVGCQLVGKPLELPVPEADWVAMTSCERAIGAAFGGGEACDRTKLASTSRRGLNLSPSLKWPA
mgnify:CR=1 FL=1